MSCRNHLLLWISRQWSHLAMCDPLCLRYTWSVLGQLKHKSINSTNKQTNKLIHQIEGIRSISFWKLRHYSEDCTMKKKSRHVWSHYHLKFHEIRLYGHGRYCYILDWRALIVCEPSSNEGGGWFHSPQGFFSDSKTLCFYAKWFLIAALRSFWCKNGV